MELELLVAYIAAGVSIITALFSFLTSKSTRRSQSQHELRMKEMESHFSDLQSERNARRDYEYEARKRLYAEVEPILFQLVELSEGALHRIYSLARATRQGNLDESNSWLENSSSNYYHHSTLYLLLAPMAAVKLLQRRINLVDFSVERNIIIQYALAKRLLITFTDDYDFAQLNPSLMYDPNSCGDDLHHVMPCIYWRQGVVIGRLENCIESMIKDDISSRPARVKSFGEFEAEWADPNSPLRGALDRIDYLINGFNPRSRPVLWRILVAQACLYRTFLDISDRKLRGEFPLEKPLRLFSDGERNLFDWRCRPDEESDIAVLDAPFRVAEQYFIKHIPDLFEARDAISS